MKIFAKIKVAALAFLIGFLSSAGLPAPVDPLEVRAGPFKKIVILNGRLSAARAENIFVPRGQSWQVQLKWIAPEGEPVSEGEVVARFDHSGLVDQLENLELDLQVKYDQRRSMLTMGEGDRLEFQLTLKSAFITFKKAEVEASIPEGLIAARDFQERQLVLSAAETALRDARLTAKNAEANLISELEKMDLEIEKNKARFDRVQAMIQAMEIHATTSGIVLHAENPWEGRKIYLGENLPRGSRVMSIPDLGSLEIEAFAPETDLVALELGQSAFINLDAFPGERHSGRVVGISSRGEASRIWGKAPYFKIRIALDETDREGLRPGMSARVEITIMDQKEYLLIPLQAVRLKNSQYWIQPLGGAPLAVTAVGLNPFYLAMDKGGPVLEGTPLEPAYNILEGR